MESGSPGKSHGRINLGDEVSESPLENLFHLMELVMQFS